MLTDACRSEATIGGVTRGEAALAYRELVLWNRSVSDVDTTAFSCRYS